MDAITVRGATKRYKDFTLDNVSFTVPNGIIMGFIGENGAGKSTTINLMLDLIKRDSGEITVLGQDARGGLDKVKEHIGVVMDECCFSDVLTARQVSNILRRVYKTWDNNAFHDYLKRFDLPPTKNIGAYSKGMKMKLSIAVALSHDSKLLVLDEATSGLDPIVRDEILDILAQFTLDESRAILLSSHILSDLEKICDCITFIHKGKVVFTSPKDELLDTYGVLRCSNSEFEAVDRANVIGVRRNAFGVEALVKRGARYNGLVEKASVEDIMLYHIKEGVAL